MNFTDKSSRKNPAGIAVVVLLHVVAGFIALKGSTVLISRLPPSIIELTSTPLPPPPPPPEPVAMPDPAPVPTTIAVPDVVIDVAPPPNPVPMTTRPASEPAPPAAASSGTGTVPVAEPAPHAPVRVAPVVDAKACTRPEYPKNALRNGDTGTVTLALLIGTDGRVAEAKVEKSSGSRELDRAALAGLSLCRFQPGSVDGVAYRSWTQMQYVWSLDE